MINIKFSAETEASPPPLTPARHPQLPALPIDSSWTLKEVPCLSYFVGATSALSKHILGVIFTFREQGHFTPLANSDIHPVLGKNEQIYGFHDWVVELCYFSTPLL